MSTGKTSVEDRFGWPIVAVICAGIVSAGIYFGLRSTDPAPVPTNVPNSSVPRVTSPSNQDKHGVMVYITKTGRKYHRGSCSFLRKSRIPIPLSDARDRYGPCSRCRPSM